MHHHFWEWKVRSVVVLTKDIVVILNESMPLIASIKRSY